VLPLDIIESKIKYKLYQLDNNKDAYLIISATYKGGTNKTILKMSMLKNIHNNMDFIVQIVHEVLTISNLEDITVLRLTFGIVEGGSSSA
jgi:hypothetical protein